MADPKIAAVATVPAAFPSCGPASTITVNEINGSKTAKPSKNR